VDTYDWSSQEQLLAGRLVPLYCTPGEEYNQLASLFLTDSDTTIKQLFHFRELGNNNRPTFSSKTLLLFFSSYVVLACITFGSAVPSGMFVPSLLQGKANTNFPIM
jgi:chloride channel 7